MTARETVLRARKALLNGSGELSYFEDRGIAVKIVEGAWVGYMADVAFRGYKGPAFIYPCIAKGGGLLAVHYKSKARNDDNKRWQKWGDYADDLPPKGRGKKPGDPAKVVPFGMETLEGLERGSQAILFCGEEDALSARQAGHTSVSQAGAGLLEAAYAKAFAGLEVVVFYDAGEEVEARKDALTLLGAGAAAVRVVEWAADAPHGTDVNGRLVEDPQSFDEWLHDMIERAKPLASDLTAKRIHRAGEPDSYERNGHADNVVPPGILLSEVVPERVRWLWEWRIALGKLNLVDGDPGTGKSAATTDLAARVTVGKAWPDGSECSAGGVVILSAEDGLADTIRPRFDAAGGDPSQVVAVSTVPDAEGNERQIAIPDDLHVIEAAIERVGAVLVVIDPLMAFLPGEVNSHRDQDVRRALAPLARLAQRTGAAVVVIRHLNKATGGNALYRGGGSIGIVGAARSGLLIAKHPEDDGRRVLASIKSNLAAPAPSLIFGLSGSESGAVRVDWKGETGLDASALLSVPTDHEERASAQDAQSFLRNTLSDGPEPVADIRKQAGEAGIGWRTVERAKASLGIRAIREGEAGKRGGGTWVWTLPAIKTANPIDWRPKSEEAPEEDEKNAYLSQKQGAELRPSGLRPPSPQSDSGGLNRPLSEDLLLGQTATLSELADRRKAGTVEALSADVIGEETRRAKSGPALALKAYLEKQNDERLKYLTKAVLTAQGRDTADWETHTAVVKAAAEDPTNHPLDCECEVCL